MAASAPQKQYQNIAVAELFAWLQTNPNRSRNLAPIEVEKTAATEGPAAGSLENMGIPHITVASLNPSNLLSLFHWIADPLYALALPTVRTAMLRDFATKLQESTDHLQGTSLARKRRRVHDWIGAIAGGGLIKDDRIGHSTVRSSAVAEDEWLECYGALATLQGRQIILVKRQTTEDGEDVLGGTGLQGEIHFATNPANWDSRLPVWIADYRGRWISETAATEVNFGQWLGAVEGMGWIVEWPEADGTKESIVGELKGQPTWTAADAKLRKEVLAKRLGRINTLAAFRPRAAGGAGSPGFD